MDNPLFPTGDNDKDRASEPAGYLLPPQKNSNITPTQPSGEAGDQENAAISYIRTKVEKIYTEEPSAKKELDEAEATRPRSKHQQFMYDLSHSGKSLAEIQTEWHEYYVGLPDEQKHQVWQEFYESNTNSTFARHAPLEQPAGTNPEVSEQPEKSGEVVVSQPEPESGLEQKPKSKSYSKSKRYTKKPVDLRSASAIRDAIRDRVSAGGKLKPKHHFQSLLFGLGLGFLVIFIFLFGFFNEFFIAPFIQPSRTASATPIILNTNGVAPTSQPEVIIPKINVEIPVIYSVASTNESVIDDALENGVVHYPNTVLPGQDGNAAFFGHSSNNIFSPGKYKFAFVLLHELVPGDTFYLTYHQKVYVYKVISKKIVKPTDTWVLGPVKGQTATATLITCDPPGTSLNRLVVVGQQISPDPGGNTKATQSQPTAQPKQIAGNGPSLWSRFIHWLF